MTETSIHKIPRVVLSGLSGGSGKTVVTLALTEMLRRKGLVVAPFKKGPDYIDVAWHSLSAGRPSHNLDTFLMEPEDILWSLGARSQSADIALIEGNRGLYDGMDADGTHSTAELARLIDAPVILVVNCTKTTRTVAALVLGCKIMDPRLRIGGVILNQVANIRQESVIRTAVEAQAGVPVLGAMPRVKNLPFSERHLGLLPPEEHPRAQSALEKLFEAARENIDADAIWQLAASAPPLVSRATAASKSVCVANRAPRIGVFRDSAFTFYYPENLEALERSGARLVELSGLRDTVLPPLDALYIGGGFPETHAQELAGNEQLRASLRREVEDGLPIYAECGGLIYLAEAVEFRGHRYPMAGVFPVTFSVADKPQGHGYVIVDVDGKNPFFKEGATLRGHEFHYAGVTAYNPAEVKTVFSVRRGYGFDCGRDGLVYKNVLASFCHVHALGEKEWAEAVVGLAIRRACAVSTISAGKSNMAV
ncbi:MAG: cobyrinate a,c-diamide synthase [Candidatus Abyssobacteria bacterium SURF_17]|uniref:Cobyrinate a,c-diamide synthase n=1 Tax=Candidatus Abyssobacteria bacterium SURF_17 TaxID=2093361 RepID=A0A419EU71_9BACT|nr:MAG: cobyrinate a,c-diamide synthase [Candidatus Abyssubacteria bacterium SURF_17]